MKIDCTTCKYGYEDERLDIPMCHHPKRFSEDCVDFNIHEEKDIKESEKPIKEGLDVTDFCKPIDPGIAQCIADHSWEMLGEDEKPAPKDLEEAADNHIRKVADTAGHPGWDWTTQDIADAFIAGAKWQKEQMMKEALDGEVSAVILRENREVHYAITYPGGESPHSITDKVRIIILSKEDSHDTRRKE